MREGHGREGDLLVAAVVDGGREAVGAADDEYPSPDRLLLLLHPASKLHAAQGASVLVEQHHMVAALELFQYQFALLLFLLFLG